ncbi:MAG: hypothetical protein J5I93_11295 [Pirellulaceae bacterium]|nr:hypothetical protein [Pirellulaceae bacterium]
MPLPSDFRRHPGLRRENPFVDEHGKNPFADPPAAGSEAAAASPSASESSPAEVNSAATDSPSTPPPAAGGENLFAAPATPTLATDERPYRPNNYVQTLPHRGGLILTLGCAGLIGSLLGTTGGLAGWLLGYNYIDAILLFGLAPLSFFSLGASLPACMMGLTDRRAMHAGAMDASGWRKTGLGLTLGLAAALLSLVLICLVLAAVAWAVLAELGG